MFINARYRLSDKVLGKGGFGTVYLGKDEVDGKDVAIKCIDLEQKSMRNIANRQKIEQEIKLMSILSHKSVVKYYDSCKTDNYWYIIMEYCNKGTLLDVINENSGNERENQARYYLTQLRDALKYLRHLGYVHRDIKPTNILLTCVKTVGCDTDDIFDMDEDYFTTESVVVKLADFGLSKCTEADAMMNTVCGSPLYMAPEVLFNRGYSIKADLWSFGVMMYQLLIGKHPHEAKTIEQLRSNIDNVEIDFHLHYGYSPHCYDLLTRLLDKNSSKRLDWDGMFDHQWFDSISEEIVEPTIDFSSQIGKIKPVSKLGNSNLSKMKFIDYPSIIKPSDSLTKSRIFRY